MKIIVLFTLFTVAVAVEFYATADDHYDIAKLLGDRQKLQVHLDCFMDKGPCTEFLNTYKKNIPEAVAEACRRCNPNQKFTFWSLVSGMKEMLPKQYQEFREHFDPENKYFDALESEISKFTTPSSD